MSIHLSNLSDAGLDLTYFYKFWARLIQSPKPADVDIPSETFHLSPYGPLPGDFYVFEFKKIGLYEIHTEWEHTLDTKLQVVGLWTPTRLTFIDLRPSKGCKIVYKVNIEKVPHPDGEFTIIYSFTQIG